MKDRQMSFDRFNQTGPSRCGNRIVLNGFVRNCFLCPYAVSTKKILSCSLNGRKITTGEKYALPAWKKLRARILTRDGNACVICSGTENLHIHHIDADNTHDDPGNLVTLCSYCHARAHSELKKAGGPRKVRQVIGYYRRDRSTKTEPGKTG